MIRIAVQAAVQPPAVQLSNVLMVCIIGLALFVIVVFAEAFSCVSLSGLGDDQQICLGTNYYI